MKWLTLEEIKQQCRIEQDFHDEDALLEMYGESAEDSILELCNRTVEDFYEHYGRIPTPVRHASLLLADLSYQHRSPVTQTSMSTAPYTFDLLLKPYMRLSFCPPPPADIAL